MEQIRTMTNDFFEGIPENIPAINEEELPVGFTDLSGMMSEALFVLDFQKRNFLHVSPHDLFLCGYTPEKIKEEGYEFFKVVLHPDDLPLWRDIHVTLLKSLYNNELPAERICFFGCTLRIRNFLSNEDKKPDYLMIHLKIKPKWQQGIPRWGICLLSPAVVPKPGNLCIYYGNHDYSSYSFITHKWTFHSFAPLSKREKQILVWSQEGFTNKEMADRLCLTVKTIEKMKTSLFEERSLTDGLNLDSFSKKLQFANNRCFIYQSPVTPPHPRKILIINTLHSMYNKTIKSYVKNREIPIAG